MLVKFKKLVDSAKIPSKSTEGAACYDMISTEEVKLYPGNIAAVSTGLSVEVPEGFVMQIFIRSGMAKEGIALANGVGVIDSDYRGEVKILLANIGYDGCWHIKPGMKIAQCSFEKLYPVDWIEVDELRPTGRNTGGFGSTGK